MDEAKKLTFDKNVNCRTVTFSGEDFRPTGVLTGGSRPNKVLLLLEWSSISNNYKRLHSIEIRMREIDGCLNFLKKSLFFLAELGRLQPLRKEYEKTSKNLLSVKKRLETIIDSIKNSPAQVLMSEIQQLEKVIL